LYRRLESRRSQLVALDDTPHNTVPLFRTYRHTAAAPLACLANFNFGFQEPWKKARENFQGLEKTPRSLSNPWEFCRRA
jgi:hypothetical protein